MPYQYALPLLTRIVTHPDTYARCRYLYNLMMHHERLLLHPAAVAATTRGMVCMAEAAATGVVPRHKQLQPGTASTSGTECSLTGVDFACSGDGRNFSVPAGTATQRSGRQDAGGASRNTEHRSSVEVQLSAAADVTVFGPDGDCDMYEVQ